MRVTTERLDVLVAQYLKQSDIDDISKKIFQAALTHWAQNPGTKPPLITQKRIDDFLSFLSEQEGKAVKKLEIEAPFQPPSNPEFKFIDLFAGIGGFRMALQDLGGKCVFSSDWDKEAQRTYQRNFGETPYGDIRLFTDPDNDDEFIRQNIPDHDILCGGFPCQPFSRAGVSARNALGKMHGFLDENQGNLFFDIVRIVEVKRPKVLFLENVKNLKSHDGGNTFAVIKKTIEDLGYSFNPMVINANTVVPQGRQRCYMVCFRNGYEFKFPDFSGEPKKLKSILEQEVDDKYTISDRLWAGHQNRTKRNLERGVGFTAFVANIDKPANTLVARYYKDGKECLIPQEGKNPRKLTERECARLMGFPDTYIVSDKRSSAYKQFGNSLVMPVVKRIASSIIPELKNIQEEEANAGRETIRGIQDSGRAEDMGESLLVPAYSD